MSAANEREGMQTILDALQSIRTANGFATESGRRVFAFQARLDDDLPSIVVSVAEMDPVDQAQHSAGAVWWRRELIVDVADKYDDADPLRIEDHLRDLQNALGPFRSRTEPTPGIREVSILGGGIINRETGSDTIGAFVRFSYEYIVRTNA